MPWVTTSSQLSCPWDTMSLHIHKIKDLRFHLAHSSRGFSPCWLSPRQGYPGGVAWGSTVLSSWCRGTLREEKGQDPPRHTQKCSLCASRCLSISEADIAGTVAVKFDSNSRIIRKNMGFRVDRSDAEGSTSHLTSLMLAERMGSIWNISQEMNTYQDTT